MTEARPKPLVGAFLGLVLGLVAMALLTVLGILPPDRLPLFGIVGLSVILVSALLTQRMALAKGRLITVIVIGALLGGVALTGIPEIVRGGSVSEDCLATATSSLETEAVTPSGTTAIDPFRVTTTDTIAWTTTTTSPLMQADAHLSVMVGGFAIPLRNSTFAEAPDLTEWSGETSVENQLDQIQDASGMLLTGTYHLSASVDTDAGECTGDAYLRIEPDGAFDGLLLVLLWSLLGLLLLIIIVLAVIVRRSISDSDATLAMVGTSAIPGGTSTTPPPAPRRTAPAEEPAETRGGRDGDGRASTDSSGADRSRGGSNDAGTRAEKTGPSERSAAAASPVAEHQDSVTPEPAAEEPPAAEDGLARSPYASPETDEGVAPDSSADAEDTTVLGTGQAQDETPLEEREGVDEGASEDEPVPVDEPAPVEDTAPVEETEPVDDPAPVNSDERTDGDDGQPGAVKPSEPRTP